MYKTAVRKMVERNVARLNEGDPEPLLALASPDAELRYPGDNSWATMFRPVEKGRAPHATHRGLDECRAFAERFVDAGIRFEIEDILVNGPPWRTRVGLRVNVFSSDGQYTNRALALLELRWGRLVVWEDYEDTERSGAWDAVRARARVEGVLTS